MGFSEAWKLVKDWTIKVWNSATFANVGNFSYQTASYVVGQPKAALRAGRAVISHADTRAFVQHTLIVGMHSMVPMFFSYLNDEIQRRGRTYLDEEEGAWLSTNNFILISLVLLNGTIWILKKRGGYQERAERVILTIESSKAVAHLSDTKICQDCTGLRFWKGSFRDQITYWLTKLILIEAVRYVPVLGESAATVLTICHNGSYIATLIWSPLCGRHLEHNLNEHLEFSLAQGLTHAGTSIVLVSAIEWGTGIPRYYYESSIQQLTLVGQVIVGAHGDLPLLVKKSNRLPIEPVRIYERVVKLGIDVVLVGSKLMILQKMKPIVKPLLNRLPQTSNIPWEKMGKTAVAVWDHKFTASIKFFVLPPMFQGQKQFVNNPLVRYNWQALRDKAVSAIIDMETISKKYAVRIASTSPEMAGEAIEVVMGTPKIVIELALRVLRNKTLMDELAKKRRILQGIHSGPSPKTQADSQASPMRGQGQRAIIIPHPQMVEEDTSDRSATPLQIPTAQNMEYTLTKRQLSNKDRLEARLEKKVLNRAAFFQRKESPETSEKQPSEQKSFETGKKREEEFEILGIVPQTNYDTQGRT